MKNFIIKALGATTLAILLSWAYLVMPQAFFSLDKRLRDFMFVMRGELPKSDKVVIVDIDEESLKEYGQWPWQRDILAELLYSLNDARVGVIGLDIVFAEEDRSSPHRFKKHFPDVKKLPNYDEIFAKAIYNTPVIGGYTFIFEENDEENTPMIPAIFVQKGMGSDSRILKPKGIVLNLEILQDSFYSSGFFNNTPDEGGMIRSVPLVMDYDGAIYSSLALEMIRIYSGAKKVELIGDSLGISSIEFGEYKIPTDKVGRLVVNFRGPGKHFKYISAMNVMNGNFKPEELEGKFVLVGTSAIGLFDLRSIPFDSVFAGVEVHANAIDNILDGDFLRQPADMVVYDLITIWVIVFFFLILFSYIKSWLIVPLAVAIMYGLFEFYFLMLFEYGLVLNLLFPFTAYVLTLILSVGIDYVIETRQKEMAKRMLGKKVSPAVMEFLLEHSSEDLVASKEVEASIFFSDIRGFTSISEKIGSPDKLIQMLNTYMTPMVDNIVNHKGTIDKFIGDAVMAYWNAPVPIKNHADKAVQSSIEQINMLVDVNKIITPLYDVIIDIGIGIHTGIVTAGDMGSEGRSDYTVIGDNVNLASRLEGLTKQYGAQVLISKATYDLLKDDYVIRPIDLVEVKGKNEAIEIFEVICSNKVITQDELLLYEKTTGFFREGKVIKACEGYEELQKLNPSKLYEFYIKRCKRFLENPDLDFTAVLKMTTK